MNVIYVKGVFGFIDPILTFSVSYIMHHIHFSNLSYCWGRKENPIQAISQLAEIYNAK